MAHQGGLGVGVVPPFSTLRLVLPHGPVLPMPLVPMDVPPRGVVEHGAHPCDESDLQQFQHLKTTTYKSIYIYMLYKLYRFNVVTIRVQRI